jgi:serine/threonine protein kinase
MERLESSGVAEVYYARRRTADGVTLALTVKRLPPSAVQDPELAAAFWSEAHTLSRLSHANTLQVHEYGRIDNSLFLAVEAVQGVPLDELIKHTRIAEDAD